MAQVALPSASAAQSDTGAAPLGTTLEQLRQIPLGLTGAEHRPQFASKPLAYLLSFLPALPGLLITAIASLFGAPFWFDLLQRLTQLRGTGAKPKTEQDKGQ